MAERLGFVTQRDRDEAQRLRRKVDELASGGGGRAGAPPSRGRRGGRGGDEGWDALWVKITAALQDGTDYRWEYSWVEVYKARAGFDGWEELEGGLSGSGEDEDPFSYAYNLIEDLNAGLVSGDPYGNGVDPENLTDTGLEVQPVPVGTIVRAWIVYPDEEGAYPELAFTYENGIDGPCAA